MDCTSRCSSSWTEAGPSVSSKIASRKLLMNESSENNINPPSLFQLIQHGDLLPRRDKAHTQAEQASEEKAQAFIQHFHRLIARHFACPICQSIAVEPVALTCSHLFCHECLDEWMEVQESKGEIKSCPVCRTIIRHDFNLLNKITASTNLSLSLFLNKVAALQKFFHQQRTQPRPQASEATQLTVFLRLLAIPYNFRIVESIHNLSDVRSKRVSHDAKSTQTMKRDLVHLILQLRLAKDDVLSSQTTRKPTQWETLQNRCDRTLKILIPRPFDELIGLLRENLFSRTQHWVWIQPKCEFYYWIIFSALFWYLIWMFGWRILQIPTVRLPVKRILEHVVFVFLDGPTNELVSVVHEAFTAPL